MEMQTFDSSTAFFLNLFPVRGKVAYDDGHHDDDDEGDDCVEDETCSPRETPSACVLVFSRFVTVHSFAPWQEFFTHSLG